MIFTATYAIEDIVMIYNSHSMSIKLPAFSKLQCPYCYRYVTAVKGGRRDLKAYPCEHVVKLDVNLHATEFNAEDGSSSVPLQDVRITLEKPPAELLETVEGGAA